MSKFYINLSETIFYLSDAFSLVGGDLVDHAKRVAFMALECGKELNWDDEQKDHLFLASILHDCGVSKTETYERILSFEGINAGNHSAKGAELLNASSALSGLSECILHHHVDWNVLKGIDLSDQVKLEANCINMLDTIDFLILYFQQEKPNILLHRDRIRRKVADGKNRVFNPKLVDVFMKVSQPEAFWLVLDNGLCSSYTKSWVEDRRKQKIDFVDLKSVVLLYSRMVDAKSFYTIQHSEGVASLSRRLGELFELDEHTCDKLELAGLLHDLGKLRVPDYILDKPDELTEEEFLIMKRHSFDTYDIIKNVGGFEDISLWASQHHERVDGSGYPFQYASQQLSLEARIVAVADVFQSYTQDRPHREKLLPEDILIILRQEMEMGKLDKQCVLMIENNIETCWKAVSLNSEELLK